MMSRFLLLLAAAVGMAVLCCACTQYERDGYNPKPFNAPAAWELRPDGYQFRN